jgi:hypothetical protein
MLPTETKQLLAGPASYNISNSLRFRASATAFLNRTFGTPTNNKIWTWSAWVKRGAISTPSNLFRAPNSTPSNGFRFETDNTLRIFFSDGAAGDVRTTQVFRDVGAWYNIVIAVDTTSATTTITGGPTDRVRVYINGVQVTNFATATAPSQNYNTQINSAIVHTIAYGIPASTESFDGYLTEINFIDGSALTPSSFGAYDPYTGVWNPIRYSGAYTGNSFYLPFINQSSSTFAATFNGTQYLTTNASSLSTNLSLGTSDFTIEYWMNTTVAASGATLCCAGSGTATYDGLFGYITGGALVTYLSSTGGSWDIASGRTVISSITIGRWYYITYTRSGSTWRVFVDGMQVDTFTSSASLYQGANQFTLARGQSTGIFTGLISNVRVIKGTALYTSNFTPPNQPLTAVTNTQLLTLQSSTVIDNSVNGFPIINTGSVAMSAATPFAQPNIAVDYSGLGNNWTQNNISLTTGITYDSMIDVPTNWIDGGNNRGNYCVFNFLDKYSTTALSNGNLSTNGSGVVRSTFGMTSGKWYWEFTPQSTLCMFGIATAAANTAQYVGQNAFGWAYYGGNGNKYNNASPVAYGATFTTNDVIGVAFDADIGTLTFYKNGTSQGTAFTGLTSGPYFAASGDNGGTAQPTAINFGQRPFSYAPPSGFLPLNTQNLVTPTILNGARFMAATTLSGDNASPRSIVSSSTNSGNNPLSTTFQPDLVWVKNRTSGLYWNVWFDSVRGAGNQISSNQTDAELASASNIAGKVSAFNADGFSVLSGSSSIISVNGTSNTYVGWQWNAGSGSSTVPTGGSITPTGASINVSAGFSIITYTGTGANATVPHGLGVAPSMIIVKRRNSTGDWPVYHSSLGNTNVVWLNLTNASTATALAWNNTSPTSSVYTIGTGTDLNASGGTYVSYCWAPISGYSAFNRYTGNGSADGTFVYTGFRPRWVLIKRTDVADQWVLFDSSRGTYNLNSPHLLPNSANAEVNAPPYGMDFLSNGFKCRAADTSMNANGGTYIYAAFAENPFKVSRAR